MNRMVNTEAKTRFKPTSGIKEIDSKYLKGYKLIKKDKNKINWEYQDDIKTKFTHNPSSTNTS